MWCRWGLSLLVAIHVIVADGSVTIDGRSIKVDGHSGDPLHNLTDPLAVEVAADEETDAIFDNQVCAELSVDQSSASSLAAVSVVLCTLHWQHSSVGSIAWQDDTLPAESL